MNTKSMIIAQAHRLRDCGDFVLGNLLLVVKEANRYSMSEEEFLDYYQSGVIGLMRAAETFDPSKDVAVSTWATMYITSKIRLEQRRMRGPVSTPEKYYRDAKTAVSAGDDSLTSFSTTKDLDRVEIDLEVARMLKKCSKLTAYQGTIASYLFSGLEPSEIGQKIGKSQVKINNTRRDIIRRLKDEYCIL